MPKESEFTLGRFLVGLLDFLFGAMIIAAAAVAVWVILFPFLAAEGTLGTASVAVRLGSGDPPGVQISLAGGLANGISSAFVDRAEGTLRLETDRPYLVAIANIATVFTALGLAYLINILRRIVRLAVRGDPFAAHAAKLLRQLALAVLLVGVGRPLVETLSAAEILNQLPDPAPDLIAGPHLNPEVFFAALLLFFLAHIWRYGAALERERALTI